MHGVPRDPETPAQLERHHFRDAVVTWRALSDCEKQKWRERAARDQRTGYHLFLTEFMAKVEAGTSRQAKRKG